MTTTSHPTAIKLTQPGSSLTMQVESASMATVGKYPEMVFVGTEVDSGGYISLSLPKSSADRQLGRLSLDMASAAGAVLVFSRDPSNDPAKPYWGINWGETPNQPAKGPIVAPRASQGPKTSAREEVPPPDDHDAPEGAVAVQGGGTRYAKLQAVFTLYDECYAHAATLARSYEDVEPDVSAMAATLFIRASNLGL